MLAVTPILQINLYRYGTVACFILHVYQSLVGFYDCFKSSALCFVFSSTFKSS